jgi:hypothetical protein
LDREKTRLNKLITDMMTKDLAFKGGETAVKQPGEFEGCGMDIGG